MQKMANTFRGLLMLILLAGFLATSIVAYDVVAFLKDKYYDEAKLLLNIIFYLSPLIALLLAKLETDREVFLVGAFLIFVYTLFIDLMYLALLLEYHEILGFKQWLYILPATLITFANYYTIKRAKVHRYCPSCRVKIKLNKQNFCHNCGIDIYRYDRKNKSNSETD